jgi:hypothetical protein
MGLRGSAVVELEHAAEPLLASDRTSSGRRGLGRDERVAQILVGPFPMIEVDNPTHIILSGGTSVIRGIPGSAVLSRYTRCSSNVGSLCVGVVWKRNGMVAA